MQNKRLKILKSLLFKYKLIYYISDICSKYNKSSNVLEQIYKNYFIGGGRYERV